MKIGGQIPWNVTPICDTSQIYYLMGRRHIKRRFGKPFEGPIIPFGSLVEYHPITAKDQSRIHQFGKKVLPGLFVGYALYAGENLEGWRTGCRPWGVGDDGRIGNLLKKTQCERGDVSKRKRRIYFANRRWTNQNPWRRSRPENIHLDTASTKSRRRSHWLSWRIRRVSSNTSRLISGCQWSDKRFLFHVGKLHIPPSRWTPSQTLLAEQEESFPVPLKYIDVSRTTHTNLDVKQEKRIDDYWNIDGSRDLSDSWTGFTQFTLLEEKPPDRYLWSRERLTRKQLTSRPDHLWPELWEKMGKNAKLKEKQKWSHEKLHLENARKLRGIYFIDPGGQGIQRDHQECSQEIGNINGSRYAKQH